LVHQANTDLFPATYRAFSSSAGDRQAVMITLLEKVAVP